MCVHFEYNGAKIDVFTPIKPATSAPDTRYTSLVIIPRCQG